MSQLGENVLLTPSVSAITEFVRVVTGVTSRVLDVLKFSSRGTSLTFSAWGRNCQMSVHGWSFRRQHPNNHQRLLSTAISSGKEKTHRSGLLYSQQDPVINLNSIALIRFHVFLICFTQDTKQRSLCALPDIVPPSARCLPRAPQSELAGVCHLH